MQGEVDVQNADEKATLTEGGYFFSPDDKPVTFENKSGKEAKIYVYRKRHEKLEGYRTHSSRRQLQRPSVAALRGNGQLHDQGSASLGGGLGV
ncbi:MAG: hypothetical protein ACLU3I_17120 [Acutalibacteraceae bacterium]